MIYHDIEQNSDEWEKIRSSIPTASNFSKIITSKGLPSKSLDSYAEVLAGSMFAGKSLDSWQGNAYTERGHEVEPIAKTWYEDTFFCDLGNGGFVTDDSQSYGASPDSFVNKNKLLEIKCLPKAHIEMLRYYSKHKHIPPKFKAQVQGQLLVCEAETVDLLFYHTDLPKLVVTVERDDQFIELLKGQIKIVNSVRDNIHDLLKSIYSNNS